MKVVFVDNALFTELEVSSTIATWSKKYDACVIDTGAWNTAIPIDDIIPPSITSSRANLKYRGQHYTTGLGFEGELSIFEATLLVGGEETYHNAQVVGVPMKWPILGREIISLYKWEIDWKSKTVKVSRDP